MPDHVIVQCFASRNETAGMLGFIRGNFRKTCLKWPLKKKTEIDFQDRLSLNAGQKYCRMLQGEHSAILSTFIKLPFVIKIFVLCIFEWSLKTGFAVQWKYICVKLYLISVVFDKLKDKASVHE